MGPHVSENNNYYLGPPTSLQDGEATIFYAFSWQLPKSCITYLANSAVGLFPPSPSRGGSQVE